MRRKIFETRNFGLLIGVVVVGLFLAATYLTPIFDNLELKLLNVHFRLKDRNRQVALQEGAIYEERNIAISPDIVILGIDTNSLTQFGRWPWPRWRHADLVNSLARITEQNTRERAIFLDTFFIEPSLDAYSDAVLVDAIANNGRVLLETVLSSEIPPGAAEDEYFQRHEVMFENRGRLTDIQGPWWEMRVYLGIEPPLQPYGAALAGYGHANFDPDYDGVYRHQPIIARVSREIEEFPLDDLTVNTPVDFDNYERLAWIDKDGDHHHIEYPVTEQVLQSLRADMERLAPLQIDSDSSDESGSDTGYYVVRRYQDQFLPSITLSLALEYFNKDFSDLDIVIGDHVTIPDPQYFDTETGEWGPYYISESAPVYDEEGSIVEPGEYRLVDQIEIPINDDGEMLINYMGPRSSSSRDGYQTYPVRSYATYASRVPGPDPYDWRPTLALDNKIVMAGPFAAGMAEDEKTTPFGLMYGVEMHANALNTIIMDRFLEYAPFWMNLVILAASVLLIAFLVGRMKNPIWSFVIMLALIAAFFLTVSIIFDRNAFIINFTSPALAMLMAFLAVLVYRALTEGRDRARTRELFATSVSPNVVEWILDRDASGELELGGENKEMTVFFSDIRGWTTFSETMEPKELLDHLNQYLSAMSDVIIEYNGTLDKYVGDEIMAFWGAPKSQREHAILACKCALKQKLVLEELNAGWPERKRLKIGMGINTGVMTAGLMGSSTKREYSLTGDNVNLGARLEGINKEYGTMIIISEGTYQLVRDQVVARELDRVYAKGKHQAVTIYELWEVKGGLTPTPEELANE